MELVSETASASPKATCVTADQALLLDGRLPGCRFCDSCCVGTAVASPPATASCVVVPAEEPICPGTLSHQYQCQPPPGSCSRKNWCVCKDKARNFSSALCRSVLRPYMHADDLLVPHPVGEETFRPTKGCARDCVRAWRYPRLDGHPERRLALFIGRSPETARAVLSSLLQRRLLHPALLLAVLPHDCIQESPHSSLPL